MHTMHIKTKHTLAALVGGLFLQTSPSLLAQATHAAADWAQTPSAVSPTDGRCLRDFQTRLRSALLLAQNAPEINEPVRLSARVSAAGRTGIRRVNIRNFQLLSDGGLGGAESNLAAGSWPSVVGALGSAVAGDYLVQAALKGIPIDGLEVIFTSGSSQPTEAEQARGITARYPRGLAYIAFIQSSATDAQLEDLKQTVERVSPVLRLIQEAQPIDHGAIEHIKTPANLKNLVAAKKPRRDVNDAGPDQAVRQVPEYLDGLREFLVDKYNGSLGSKPAHSFNPDPAADYYQQDTAEFNALKAAKSEGWFSSLRSHTKVEADTGIRNIRTAGSNFQVIHDYPRYLAGHNLGPVPEEDILSRMITCLTHIYEIVASQKQIKVDGLELQVWGTLTSRLGNIANPPSYKDISYRAKIHSPESHEKIVELQQAVEKVCPIYNMLKNTQKVKGTLVRGAYSVEKEKSASQ
jgi:uncharacterized OsmC-like protein